MSAKDSHIRTHAELMSRRAWLLRQGCGVGSVALASLLAPATAALATPSSWAPKRAKRVLFLYMDGGVSQVDSFDPKPRLKQDHGQPIGMDIPETQFNDVGTVLASPWEFQPGGESGIEVSDLFPQIRSKVDDLAVVRSMTSNFSEHTFANYFLHTGSGFQGRPSMGAWWSYGLGTGNENLPSFVALNGGLIPPGGLDCFGSGFLPAEHQASTMRPVGELLPNLRPVLGGEAQQHQLDLVRSLDQIGWNDEPAIDAAIANHEQAFLMQTALPEVARLDKEPDLVKKMYGLESEFEPERSYGTQCLIARRLIERGVRFVELTCPAISGLDRWDQHQDLKRGHRMNAQAVDRPIAALIDDLKGLGLWEETLVVWTGEFGRTPVAQGSDGRDHNPHGFSMWFAGAGVRGGTVVGATDDYGYFAVEDRYEIHDMHATMLHLMGIDHRKLTHRFDSRDMRLTDVHGKLIEGILS